MKTMAIFLRGINVNGINIKMDELKKVIEALGYIDVKTVLASGNIIATSTDDELSYENHKNKIEKELGAHFNYEAVVKIKTEEEILEILEELKDHEVPDGYHHYVLISDGNAVGEQLMLLFETCNKTENEQLILGKHGIYWIVLKGKTLESDFGSRILGKKEFKNKLTSRTAKTLEKMSKYLI